MSLLSQPSAALKGRKKPASMVARVRLRTNLMVGSIAQQLVSALLWFMCLSLVGGTLMVAGVYELAGRGWALVVGGLFCLFLAAFIRKGMTSA